MAIPINPLSDKSVAYRSVVDFYSARSSFAIPRKVILCLTDRCNMRCNMCTLQHTTVEKKELEEINKKWNEFLHTGIPDEDE